MRSIEFYLLTIWHYFKKMVKHWRPKGWLNKELMEFFDKIKNPLYCFHAIPLQVGLILSYLWNYIRKFLAIKHKLTFWLTNYVEKKKKKQKVQIDDKVMYTCKHYELYTHKGEWEINKPQTWTMKLKVKHFCYTEGILSLPFLYLCAYTSSYS